MKFLKEEFTSKNKVGFVILDSIGGSLVTTLILYFLIANEELNQVFDALRNDGKLMLIVGVIFFVIFSILFSFIQLIPYFEDKISNKKKAKKVTK